MLTVKGCFALGCLLLTFINTEASEFSLQLLHDRLAAMHTATGASSLSSFEGCCQAGLGATAMMFCSNHSGFGERVPIVAKLRAQAEHDGFTHRHTHRDVVGSRQHVFILSHATPHIFAWARYSMAVNSAWAWRHRHVMVIDTRTRTGLQLQGPYLNAVHAAIIPDWLPHAVGFDWLLWIDADAVIVRHDAHVDWLQDILQDVAPNTQVIVCRASSIHRMTHLWDQHGNSTAVNIGVILFRISAWTMNFFKHFSLDNPYFQDGWTDQELFSYWLYQNAFGLSDVTVVLPAQAFNSDPVQIISTSPEHQPVVHLASHAAEVREGFFQYVWTQMCNASPSDSWDLKRAYVSELRAFTLSGDASHFGKLAAHIEPGSEQVDLLQRVVAAAHENQIVDKSLRNKLSLLGSQNRLGRALLDAGRHAEAETMFKIVIRKFKLQFEGSEEGRLPANIEVSHSATVNLASALAGQGRMAELEVVLRRSVVFADEQLVSLTAKHIPDWALGAWNNYGMILWRKNQEQHAAEAEVLWRRAQVTCPCKFGVEAVQCRAIAENLGKGLHQQGRLPEAELLLGNAK